MSKNETNFTFPNLTMERSEFLSYFRRYLIDTYGNLTMAAADLGVSAQFISMVLNGKRPVPDTILADIGFKKISIRSYLYSPIDTTTNKKEDNEKKAEKDKDLEILKNKVLHFLGKYPVLTLDYLHNHIGEKPMGIRMDYVLTVMLQEDLIVYDTERGRVALKKNVDLMP